jgi:cyclic dehypoxanthinyl futalosine synthase
MKSINNIIDKIKNGARLGKNDAKILLQDAETLVLGLLANEKRKNIHPDNTITYVVDRNINYTNICVSKCFFCAFCRDKSDTDAYVISKKELCLKIEETLELGGAQILLQGGMHPDLNINFYIDMLKYIKENFDIHIHGFSPPEIFYIAQKEGISIKDTLQELIKAGLNSIPGGGAEILVDEVRNKVSPNKCSAEKWLKVMETAHMLSLRSSATMMFGHIEKTDHIIEHLFKIRELQDKTKGFTAFIPWSFQPENTKINVKTATGVEYLRVLAVSRLFLDNIDNIQASWVTQGDKIAQIALSFGANDMGSTMIEENVVAAAGVNFRLPEKEIIRLIKNAGFNAAQRNCFYERLKEF